MKTVAAILFISAFISINALSQIVSYEKGQIVTKNNDTIRALVELTPTYEKYVSYKINNGASIQRIKLNQIKSLETPYNLFLNVALAKEDLLFRLAVKGDPSLLVYSKVNMSNRSYSAYGGTIREGAPPTIIYAIRTIERDYIIYKKKDIDQIQPLLENCPTALEVVNSKTFKLEDIEKVVNNLNNCNK